MFSFNTNQQRWLYWIQVERIKKKLKKKAKGWIKSVCAKQVQKTMIKEMYTLGEPPNIVSLHRDAGYYAFTR